MIIFRDRASTLLYEVLSLSDKNKKFLLPLNICPIVPETFLKANVNFAFIDIDINTLCMSQNLALEAIANDSSIGGILFVKTFGTKIDSELFYRKIKDTNPDVFIIDDQCLSEQDFCFNIDKSLASLTLFSSGYSKYVDIGYGGFGFLKDGEFNSFFQDDSKSKNFLAYKKEIKKKIPLMRKHKEKINSIYRRNIPSDLHLGESFADWRFSILINNKDLLLEKIFQEKDLFASSHYSAIDFHYEDNPIKDSNTQKVAEKIINLFNDFRYTEEKAIRTAKIVNNFYKHYSHDNE